MLLRVGEIWFLGEKNPNQKGHVAEITKLGVDEGLKKLILPGGNNKVGWNGFLPLSSAPTNEPINKHKPNYVSSSSPPLTKRFSIILRKRATNHKSSIHNNPLLQFYSFPIKWTCNIRPKHFHHHHLTKLAKRLVYFSLPCFSLLCIFLVRVMLLLVWWIFSLFGSSLLYSLDISFIDEIVSYPKKIIQ